MRSDQGLGGFRMPESWLALPDMVFKVALIQRFDRRGAFTVRG
jgi:hypothetical protein